MDLRAAIGLEPGGAPAGPDVQPELREQTRALLGRGPANERCPADSRIEEFLNAYFADVVGRERLELPIALTLPRHGLARELSLPEDGDTFSNEYLTSHRVRNGVLHNPRSDRRTTSGTFHVCEGGLPIPGDKKSVPRATFVALFRQAVAAPAELLAVPFAGTASSPPRAYCSLLLRPIVSPAVDGVGVEKSLEVRFFAPAGLVSNLDFVESIFGNAGDPYLPENDSALDAEHWTGHTGCVILAPHLTKLTKRTLGLPEWASATERQRRDGMCWRDPSVREVQRRTGVQSHLPNGRRRNCHADRRQLLRLLQEGSQNADLLCGESVRQHRGGALGRRDCFRPLQPGPRIQCGRIRTAQGDSP